MDGEKVSVKAISDKAEAFEGRMEAFIMDFGGDILWNETIGCRLQADESADLMSVDAALLDGNRLLYVRILKDGVTVSENTFYTRFPKEYEYGCPEISFEVQECAEGLELTVSSDRLARGLYLFSDNADDFFEDNYMDLLPGFPRKITVRTGSTAEEFKTTLKYQTL